MDTVETAGLDEAAVRELVRRVLENSDAEGTEVLVSASNRALTRFANGEIHQNVTETAVDVRVRVLAGRRSGVASTNQVDEKSLRSTVRRAIESAAHLPEGDVTPLAPAVKVAPAQISRDTAEATPEERADRVALICEPAERAGVRAFGALSTGVVRYTVANSRGLFVHTPRAVAMLKIVTMSDGGSGYADRCSPRLAEIDAAGAGAEAIEKALRTIGAEAIVPGLYPVVLEESAVGEILEHVGYMGFSAQDVEEGRSFMRLGERVTGSQVTIRDDGNDPNGIPMPFDFEGVPRQAVVLIDHGVATGILYDSLSARRAGTVSTGHGMPAPNPYGPRGTNLFMDGGSAPNKEALLEGIARGVWVTRLHYVNPVQSRQSSLTGMTRDGTFLIENGKVTRPIKDMRFTQSIMEAFEGVTAITRATRLVPSDD
ncbi:MAG: TldD/PmbA family protein, partial [Candidatus Dormibacteria bacterium]